MRGRAVRVRAPGCGDGVSDDHGVWSDEDFFDEETDDALAVSHGCAVGGVVEAVEEAVEVLRQCEVGDAVDELRVELGEAAAQAGFLGS